MLVLSRKINESIVIDGRIVVKIVRIDNDAVRIGIEAAIDVPVHRQEIYDELQRTNKEALASASSPLPKLPPSKPSSSRKETRASLKAAQAPLPVGQDQKPVNQPS